MNIYNLIGYFILILPFIGLFWFIAKTEGIKVAAAISLIIIALAAFSFVGNYLIRL